MRSMKVLPAGEVWPKKPFWTMSFECLAAARASWAFARTAPTPAAARRSLIRQSTLCSSAAVPCPAASVSAPVQLDAAAPGAWASAQAVTIASAVGVRPRLGIQPASAPPVGARFQPRPWTRVLGGGCRVWTDVQEEVPGPRIGAMEGTAPLDSLAAAVRDSGLVGERTSGVALCSGGADSAALLAGLVGACGPDRVLALHLNYGLRPDSGEDERTCRALCERLGVELVGRAARAAGPGQPAGPRPGGPLRRRRGAALGAGPGLGRERAHPHRPGRDRRLPARDLAGQPRAARARASPRASCPPAAGAGARTACRELAEEAGLPFRDDPSNAEPRFARNRIRNEVMPVLERDRARRRGDDRRDPGRAAGGGPRRWSGWPPRRSRPPAAPGAVAIGADALAGARPRGPAATPCGPARRAGRGRVGGTGPRAGSSAIWRLARLPEGGVVELGGGLEARIEHGQVRFAIGPEAAPAEASLTVPGSCRFGAWEVRAELREAPPRRRPAPKRRRSIPAALARDARRAAVARRRPHAPARAGRHQVAAGPVHRPQGAALAAAHAAGRHLGGPHRLDRGRRRLRGVRCTARVRAAGGAERELPPAEATGPRDPHRLPPVEGDERIGEVLVSEEDLQRRVTELGGRGQPRLLPAATCCLVGDPEGRRPVPRRPDAPAHGPLRARLHGGLQLRLLDGLLRASSGSSRTSTPRSAAATC